MKVYLYKVLMDICVTFECNEIINIIVRRMIIKEKI